MRDLFVICKYMIVFSLTAKACPFIRRSTSDANPGNPRSPGITTMSSNICRKTNSYFANPTKEGICSVHKELEMNFQYILTTSGVPVSSLFGSVVRLAFHDAGEVDVTKYTDRLGPDGCLATDGSSAGLVEENSIAITTIEPIYQRVCDRISRADFWALFGKIVVERAASVPINVVFQFGRTDNIDCEGGGGRLPRAEGGMDELSRVFVTQMGLTMEDAGLYTVIYRYCLRQNFMSCQHNYSYPIQLPFWVRIPLATHTLMFLDTDLEMTGLTRKFSTLGMILQQYWIMTTIFN